MIPLKDDNPTRIFPFVTFGLIFLNLLVYIYQLFLEPSEQQSFIMRAGLIPYEITHFEKLTYEEGIPLYVTPFTSMFVHGGFFHLAANMLYLWIFGDNIEEILGHFRFVGFYILCGLAAVFFQVLSSPDSQLPVVGASGAIAGVLGAYLVRFPGAGVYTLIFFFFFIRIIRIPALFLLGLWFLLQISGAFPSLLVKGGGIAWFAHIGGFLVGVILMVKYLRRGKRGYTTY